MAMVWLLLLAFICGSSGTEMESLAANPVGQNCTFSGFPDCQVFGDYSRLSNVKNASVCKDKCCNDENCEVTTYDSTGHICFFHNSSAIVSTGYNNLEAFLKNLPDPCQWTVSHSKQIMGDFLQNGSWNMTTCEAQCCRTSGCKAITYDSTYSQCYLHDHTDTVDAPSNLSVAVRKSDL
eukprot:TRINITY_DN6100_c0_g1_i1.p1 TRINITY_DN6100_c0_g1~~TRINITY_DN6100_c0_g1_i1.p1  ORF type:complete len:179 (+),score=11.24 TRINITY_DN6100_c0_g1_i1:58-594(+)